MGDVVSFDTSDCYVRASERLVGTIGVESLVIVETAGLQCWWRTKTKFKTLKKIVATLANRGSQRTPLSQ